MLAVAATVLMYSLLAVAAAQSDCTHSTKNFDFFVFVEFSTGADSYFDHGGVSYIIIICYSV